jgi:4-hydroxy-3-methylbut-2-en-1-yl diphosphate synthase IspG/GcpE
MDRLKQRKTTRQVMVGSVPVGGLAPISVQSMTNTPTQDAAATAAQIRRLEEAGCDIVRVAVPDAEAAARLEHGVTLRYVARGPRSSSRFRAKATSSRPTGASMRRL